MFPSLRPLYSRQQSASGIPSELDRWVDLIRRGMAGGGWAEWQLCQATPFQQPHHPVGPAWSPCPSHNLCAPSPVPSPPSSLPGVLARAAAGSHSRQVAWPKQRLGGSRAPVCQDPSPQAPHLQSHQQESPSLGSSVCQEDPGSGLY